MRLLHSVSVALKPPIFKHSRDTVPSPTIQFSTASAFRCGVDEQVAIELVHAADRSQSHLPDRRSELDLLVRTLKAKTDAEEKEEKKLLDRDMDDIGEGSARGTVRLQGISCLSDLNSSSVHSTLFISCCAGSLLT